MKKKIEKKFFLFEIYSSKFVSIQRSYLPSAVSVLRSSFEIFHITNRDFL